MGGSTSSGSRQAFLTIVAIVCSFLLSDDAGSPSGLLRNPYSRREGRAGPPRLGLDKRSSRQLVATSGDLQRISATRSSSADPVTDVIGQLLADDHAHRGGEVIAIVVGLTLAPLRLAPRG